MKTFAKRVTLVALSIIMFIALIAPVKASQPIISLVFSFDAAELSLFDAPDGGKAVELSLTPDQIAEITQLSNMSMDITVGIAVINMDGLVGAELSIELAPLIDAGLIQLRFYIIPHPSEDTTIVIPEDALRDMSRRADIVKIGLYLPEDSPDDSNELIIKPYYGWCTRVVLSGENKTPNNGEKPIWPGRDDFYNFNCPLRLIIPYNLEKHFLSEASIDTELLVVTEYVTENTIDGTKIAIPRSTFMPGMGGDYMIAKIYSGGIFDVLYRGGLSGLEYADIEGHWAKNAIRYVTARCPGLWYSDEDIAVFYPGKTVTRAEFTFLLNNVLRMNASFQGLPPLLPPPWTDQKDIPAWAEGSINSARALGLVQGSTSGKFNPNSPITRQEMFVMMYRAMQHGFAIPAIQARTDNPKDSKNIAAWAEKETLYLYHNGLISGSDGYIRPQNQITRAEAAQMLYNLLKSEW